MSRRVLACVGLAAWLVLPGHVAGQDEPLVSARLSALAARLTAGPTNARAELDAFWAEMAKRTTPLVEPLADDRLLVTFLWRETEPLDNVAVVGWVGGFDPSANVMEKVNGSDVWFRSYVARGDLRTTYSFSANDTLEPLSPANSQERMAAFQPDPLNPRRFVFRRNPAYPGSVDRIVSVVELPHADSQPWIDEQGGVPKGALEDHDLRSVILDNDRTVTVYTPVGYDSDRTEPYPLVVLFDRAAYLRLVPTPTILDNLIAAERIPPLVAVLVGNVDRSTELACDEPFGRFLADELVPWMRNRYRVTSGSTRTVVAGSSYGGLASSCAALRHPEVFGNVLSQSGSYWWAPDDDDEREWLAREFVTRERTDTRFYLDIGLLESGPTFDGGPSMLVTNRHLRDVLQAKGYRVTYREINSGHDYISWRGTLADGLIALLGGE